jgi:hypothetical protein
VRLDEARFGGDTFEILEDGIEALDVADLEDAAVLVRKLDQLGGLRGVVGHRLLDQNVLASKDQLFGEIEVSGGRRNDAEGIGGFGGFGNGREDAGARFLSDAAGSVGSDIVHSGKLNFAVVGEFSVDARVFLAERSGAEDGDTDFFRGA